MKRRFLFFLVGLAVVVAVLWWRHGRPGEDGQVKPAVAGAAAQPAAQANAFAPSPPPAPAPSVSAPAAPPSSVSRPMAAPSPAANQPPSRRFGRAMASPHHPRQGADRFAGAQQVESRESAPDAEGRVTRTRLLRADFKYPLIRVEETVAKDARTGEETLLKQTAMVGDHIMVKLKPEMTTPGIEELARKHNGQLLKKMSAPDLYLVRFPGAGIDAVPQAVQALTAETNAVAYAEPDFIIHALDTLPTDALFGGQWALQNTGQNGGTPGTDIRAPAAWDISRGSSNVLVAVLDTGIDYNHPDLAANIWINPGEVGILSTNTLDDDGNGYTNDFHGWNFVSENNNPIDDNGHGTHCAGIIGAVGDNSIGVAGVCWNVSLVGLKILNANGELGVSSDAVEAIIYAIKLRANVLSLSWRGTSFQQTLQDAIQQAATNNILVVAAAGNDGANNDTTPVYPASYTNANIISVASSTANDALSDFSNYGSTKVDIAAPGDQILSTWPLRKYKTLSGTSMACPYVAGAAALLLSCEPWLSALDVKQGAMATADPVPALTAKVKSGGRLNLAKLLNNSPGLHFDRHRYFAGSWATITLANTNLAGTPNQAITLSSTLGDAETLTLFPSQPGRSIFTNRIWIAASATPAVGNGQLEGVQGTVFTAAYTNAGPGLGYTVTSEMNQSLRIVITTPETILPFETNQIQISGFNNGNVPANMIVSNTVTGDAKFFSTVNSWTSPSFAIATGPNLISVWGTNIYGFASSDTITVTRRGPPGETNYVSLDGSHQWPFLTWATAATNIQDAVYAASPGNPVLVSNGVFRIPQQIEINSRTTVQALNGASNTTVMADGFDRCFLISHTNAVLDGFTAINGKADQGGGIYCDEGGIVTSCMIRSNSAGYGGGLYCNDARLLTNCTISGNRATAYGGGVQCNGRLLIIDCQFLANDALAGGGACVQAGSPQIKGCVLSSNRASAIGGGVFANSTFSLSDSTVMGNQSGQDGGGIYSYSGWSVITNCLISANHAQAYGGGISCSSGDVLQDCVISSNSSGNNFDGGGGGIYCFSPQGATIAGCSVVNNSTYLKGGGILVKGPATVNNCNIERNIVTPGGLDVSSGGGISAYGCTIADCSIRDNRSREGGGVFMDGGLIAHCMIMSNNAPAGIGGGVRMVSGTLHTCLIGSNVARHGGGVYADRILLGGNLILNCLVLDNIAATDGGGVFGTWTIANCTIVRNFAYGRGGGVYRPQGGESINTILYFNNAATGNNFYDYYEGMAYSNCCTCPRRGSACITNDPGFVNMPTGDFHIRASSPCIDRGLNLNQFVTNDLAGNPRPLDGNGSSMATFDIGAYEYVPVPTSPRILVPFASRTNVLGSVVTLSVEVDGSLPLFYQWRFNETNLPESTNATLTVTNLAFAQAGLYSILITNSFGSVTSLAAALTVRAPTIGYVWPNSPTPLAPYSSWANAAHDIQSAIDAMLDGDSVLVTNGIYPVSNQISISIGVAARSVNGPAVTIVDGGYPLRATRCFYLSHLNALVDGFTITGGQAKFGAGVYLDGYGTMNRCLIVNNVATADGGGAYQYYGGILLNCALSNNTAASAGGGIYAYHGGSLQNCLISRNTATTSIEYSFGGGAGCDSGGKLQNCTITGNTAKSGGGGVWCVLGGTLENTIVYYNGDNVYESGSGMTYSNCCTVPARGNACVTNGPGFANLTAGNYHLSANSPCINSGRNETWMAGAKDLDGFDRIINGRVDIGAYEYTPASITPAFDGAHLSLCWPTNCLGWELQAQTNSLSVGLSTNWFPMPGSTNKTQVSFPIDPASPCVFYRLRRP
jgi:subtilisin family serine protease